MGVPYLGVGPVIRTAAFQNGQGKARDRSHVVQNISPFGRALAPNNSCLSHPSNALSLTCHSHTLQTTNPSLPRLAKWSASNFLGHSTWDPRALVLSLVIFLRRAVPRGYGPK